MDWITKLGRFLFAVPMVGFGIQHFIYTGYLVGVEVVPEWVPAHTFFAYFTGAALIAAGVSIAVGWKARLSASLLAVIFCLCLLSVHSSRVVAIVRDVVERTRAFETLALCAGALLVVGTFPPEHAAFAGAVEPARWLLALALVIFGLDHIPVAVPIAALVPSWIPWHLFWVYLSAAGFIAAGLAFITGMHVRLAGLLLAFMFFLWVVVLHGPRVAMKLNSGDEWNSLFVAVAMCGIGLLAASTLPRYSESPVRVPRREVEGVFQ